MEYLTDMELALLTQPQLRAYINNLSPLGKHTGPVWDLQQMNNAKHEARKYCQHAIFTSSEGGGYGFSECSTCGHVWGGE